MQSLPVLPGRPRDRMGGATAKLHTEGAMHASVHKDTSVILSLNIGLLANGIRVPIGNMIISGTSNFLLYTTYIIATMLYSFCYCKLECDLCRTNMLNSPASECLPFY